MLFHKNFDIFAISILSAALIEISEMYSVFTEKLLKFVNNKCDMFYNIVTPVGTHI